MKKMCPLSNEYADYVEHTLSHHDMLEVLCRIEKSISVLARCIVVPTSHCHEHAQQIDLPLCA